MQSSQTERNLLTRVKFPSRIPTSSQLQAAVEEGWSDRIRTVQDEIAVAEGCHFDEAKAKAVVDFFQQRLTHGKDPWFGKSFQLLPWQREQLIEPLYGWCSAEGFRRYRSMFVFVPKKQGKSEICAGISLVEFHYVKGSRVYILGVSEEQASEVYDESAGMVERSKPMLKYIKVLRSTGRLIWKSRNSLLMTMTKSAASSQGKNASCLILDELHAWTDRKLFDSLLYAGATKNNPLLAMITTAGDDVNGLCYAEYERAKRIVDGDDPSTDHLAIVYEADPDASYDDLEQWKKSNPSYGCTTPERGIIADIRAAKGNPQRIAAIKRYRLNIWTQAGSTWLDSATWSNCELVDEDSVSGLLWGGLDLARVRDFAALVLLFMRDDKTFDVIPRIYCPEGQIKTKEEEDKIPLAAWIDAGWVIATEGNEIDQERILQDILAANQRWGFAEIGYDSYNAGMLSKTIREQGIVATAVPQTMSYLGFPSAELERSISDRRIRHNGNPCLRWMVGNTRAITDANLNVRPCKKRSKARIDGVTATIIALQRALSPDAARPIGETPFQWV